MPASLRRFALLPVLAILAALGIALVPMSAASALPVGAVTVFGGADVSDTGTPTRTWVQDSPVAVVTVSTLSIGLGETLDIDQDPGDVLVLVLPSGSSNIQGLIHADATLVLLTPDGAVFGGGSVVVAGESFIVAASYASSSADLETPEHMTFAPVAGSSLSIDPGASLVATTGTLALIGDDIVNNGTIATGDGDLVLATGDEFDIDLDPFSINSPSAPTSTPGTITVNGVLAATDGLIMLLGDETTEVVVSGVIAATAGAIGVRGEAQFLSGSVASATGPATDPVGHLTGAWLVDGDPVEVDTGVMFPLGGTAGAAIHNAAGMIASDLVIDGHYTSSSLAAGCLVDDETNEFVVQLTIGGLVDTDDSVDYLAGIDTSVPDQGPIALAGGNQLYINEQSRTTVDGYEILTVVPMRFTGPDGDYSIGTSACARVLPATTDPDDGGPTLAATGLGTVGVVTAGGSALILVLAGLVVVFGARRRRA